MTLQARIIGDPVARFRVEMNLLALFATIAAALPGIHGAGVSRCLSGSACFVEPPVAVVEQGPRNLRSA